MSARSNESFFIPKLTIIGTGLIGGSLALALKKHKAVGHVTGVGRNLKNLETALSMGVIDQIEQDPSRAVINADVVLLATPVCSISDVLRKISDNLTDQSIISDVGSVKQTVVDAARIGLDTNFHQFVPAHPIAGAEKSGASAAKADLYINRKVVLTPTESTSLEALATIRRMWQIVGAEVSEMSAAQHDEIFAATSHLPHMLAYGLVHFLLSEDRERGFFEYAAGGFADFTRIASSDPVMWRDICLCNREALVDAIRGFQKTLESIKQMIQDGSERDLYALFNEAKSHRDDWLENQE